MNEIPAAYFDGRTSQRQRVRLRWHAADGVVEVINGETIQRYPDSEVTVESRLGNAPRFVRFANGGRCEVPGTLEVDAILETWAPNRSARLLHRFESSWPWVAVAVIVLLGVSALAVYFGLPWAARRVAFSLPTGITRQLGDQTLAILDRTVLAPSKLEDARRQALQRQFKNYLAQIADEIPYQIEFRSMREAGANAFALPSGEIVITDELVLFAENDREIVAVLAHECGHIRHRHALRAVLQNSAVFVMIALVTGDVSSATAFGGALPTYLLQSRFSREFEREADRHAVETLRAAGIEPAHLARMLERLAASHGGDGPGALGYLRTHPPTQERIQMVDGKR